MTQDNAEERRAQLRRAALEYHEFPTPGKISIAATKQLVNQHDLALAYSPGVAAPCEEIVKDPNAAFKYTSRGNLVGVITNGTAVLGLGDISKNSRALMCLTSKSMKKTRRSWSRSLPR
jgi:malate dehydrogenase (oxaloacetate-decarboxylating)(NADP+)